MKEPTRCAWASDDPLYQAYHDEEWGVPLHDDQRFFEFLLLEGAQAGLSWRTILNRRQGYGAAYADFDPAVVAAYGEAERARLLADTGIIRNRAKVDASIGNAQCFLELQEQEGSFCAYLWGFVDGRPVVNRWRTMADIPASTELSATVSADLKRRGFRFVGPTIVYAQLQAVGVVNDHVVDCFRFAELTR